MFIVIKQYYFLTLGEACTIVLRGATQQILDEAERSLHDALCVLAQTVKDSRTVYGGGKHLKQSEHVLFPYSNGFCLYL